MIAAAFADGDIGVAHVDAIDRLCRDIGVDQVAAVQHEMVTAATELRSGGTYDAAGARAAGLVDEVQARGR